MILADDRKHFIEDKPIGQEHFLHVEIQLCDEVQARDRGRPSSG
jgi:hypothetical protein